MSSTSTPGPSQAQAQPSTPDLRPLARDPATGRLLHGHNFKKRTPEQLRATITFLLDKILPSASNHGGRTFGGFVRDVLVPYKVFNGDITKCQNFKDLDLWFESKEDIKGFMKDMKIQKGYELTKQSPLEEMDPEPDYSGLYPFKVYHVMICDGDKPMTFADIILANKFPVNDFDVNTLVAHSFCPISEAKSLEMIFYLESLNKRFTTESLVIGIMHKTANMLESYQDKASHPYRTEHNRKIINRIKTRYLDRGWTVLVNGHQFGLENFEGTIMVPTKVAVSAIHYDRVWEKFTSSFASEIGPVIKEDDETRFCG